MSLFASSLFHSQTRLMPWLCTCAVPALGVCTDRKMSSESSHDNSLRRSSVFAINVRLQSCCLAQQVERAARFVIVSTLAATQVIWTRKVIPVSAPVVSAVLDVGCDDDMQVYVNGTQIVNDNNGSGTSVLGIDIAPQLVQGNTVIAARCVNVQPSFHAIGAILTLSLDVRAIKVPTLSAGALALLALLLALSVSFAPRRR